ncbi:putative ankyrin repeat protein RF_0381 isoform X2 [Ptychodera flava]|uniref:putative ankyrin repeat protein RF_0381 isoform X2 n=1 Tax=Ptychodera flava TaxID=63121 RepID=UPI00396A952A
MYSREKAPPSEAPRAEICSDVLKRNRAVQGCQIASLLKMPDDKSKQLWNAVDTGQYKEAKKLIGKSSCDVNYKNESRFEATALHQAAKKGYVEHVKLLMKFKADVEAKTKDGWTPIHYAAEEGYTEIVQLMLKQAKNVDCTTKGGSTPLFLAAKNGHTDTVRVLKEAGADVSQRKGEVSPLQIAAQNGHLLTLEYLIKSGATELTGAFHSAIEKGYIDVVRLLKDSGANVEAKTTAGDYPIHLAAWNGRSNIIQYLLKMGAKINATNKGGDTALHYAAFCGEKETMEVLLNNGADSFVENNKGETAFDRAEQENNQECASILRPYHRANKACASMSYRIAYSTSSYSHTQV